MLHSFPIMPCSSPVSARFLSIDPAVCACVTVCVFIADVFLLLLSPIRLFFSAFLCCLSPSKILLQLSIEVYPPPPYPDSFFSGMWWPPSKNRSRSVFTMSERSAGLNDQLRLSLHCKERERLLWPRAVWRRFRNAIASFNTNLVLTVSLFVPFDRAPYPCSRLLSGWIQFSQDCHSVEHTVGWQLWTHLGQL